MKLNAIKHPSISSKEIQVNSGSIGSNTNCKEKPTGNASRINGWGNNEIIPGAFLPDKEAILANARMRGIRGKKVS